MLSLHTNVASLAIQNTLSSSQSALTASMSRLGTGYRINSAADDAAGLQIATRLQAQTRGMSVAMQNTQNAMSLLQTADGAFNELSNVVLRMKDLATQAADASTTSKDYGALQSEYDTLGAELLNIMQNTSYGDEKLLDTANNGKLTSALQFQIGASSEETMTFDLSSALSAVDTAFGSISAAYGDPSTAPGDGTDISTQDGANAMINTLKDALDSIGNIRSQLGAAENRLTHVSANLSNMSSNTTDAYGRIMDVDYASETANMTSKQILLQAGGSMLKQASSMSQMVLSLLQ